MPSIYWLPLYFQASPNTKLDKFSMPKAQLLEASSSTKKKTNQALAFGKIGGSSPSRSNKWWGWDVEHTFFSSCFFFKKGSVIILKLHSVDFFGGELLRKK